MKVLGKLTLGGIRIHRHILYLLAMLLKHPKTFKFQGKHYQYFYHRYNHTRRNERAVEIPIIWKIVKKNSGRILEVGNVFSNYFSFEHDILDKYDKAEGVINQDVTEFKPAKKYDLIVSISTLDHVGFNETPQDPKKILEAIQNLKNCLADKGKLVITLTLGFNQDVDKLINNEEIKFNERYYLKKSRLIINGKR